MQLHVTHVESVYLPGPLVDGAPNVRTKYHFGGRVDELAGQRSRERNVFGEDTSLRKRRVPSRRRRRVVRR
jgi:hypothetical protein